MALDLITTTAGRAAILAAVGTGSTRAVKDVQISEVNQAVGLGTVALSSVFKTVTSVVGSIRAAGAGHSMHVVVKDDSVDAYSMRAFVLRLTDNTVLMAYSQATPIAVKGSGSSLHFAFDLTIDADTAATITFGDTDYVLPASSTTAPGIVELATDAETLAGTDAVRAVTPAALTAVLSERQHCEIPIPLSSFRLLSGWNVPAVSLGHYVLVSAAGHAMVAEVPLPEGMIIDRIRFASRGDLYATHFRAAAGISRRMDGIETPPFDDWLTSVFLDQDVFHIAAGAMNVAEINPTPEPYGPVGRGCVLRLIIVSRTTSTFGNLYFYKAQINGSVPLTSGTPY